MRNMAKNQNHTQLFNMQLFKNHTQLFNMAKNENHTQTPHRAKVPTRETNEIDNFREKWNPKPHSIQDQKDPESQES